MFLTRFESSVFLKPVFHIYQNKPPQMDQLGYCAFISTIPTSAIDHAFQFYMMGNFLVNAVSSVFEDSLTDRFSLVCREY